VLLNPLSASTLSANPQSRLQITDVLANQTEAIYKFNDGLGFKHTALAASSSTAKHRRSTNMSGSARK